MKDEEKIRVLLPHWIEHNSSHKKEFENWAEIIKNTGRSDVAELMQQAVTFLDNAGLVLSDALEKAGGPVQETDAHHTHHHHH